MSEKETRQHQRYHLAIPAGFIELDTPLEKPPSLKATIISFSAGGCAIRTASRLQDGTAIKIQIPVIDHNAHVHEIQGRIVWGKDEYRIDTFYQYGVVFSEPLKQEMLDEILREEAICAAAPGKHPQPDTEHKVA